MVQEHELLLQKTLVWLPAPVSDTGSRLPVTLVSGDPMALFWSLGGGTHTHTPLKTYRRSAWKTKIDD